MLGNTLAAIAAEKAGIIKTLRPVVIGRMPPAAETTIRSVAAASGATVLSVRDEFGEDITRYPQSNLEGDYQKWNAATAALAARQLHPKFGVTEASINAGLGTVDWPGRWQRTELGGRLAILDSSHNPEGAGVLDSNLTRLGLETGRAPVAIVGALGSMRAGPLLEVLCRHCSELHLVVPHQARASTHAELEALVPQTFHGRVFRSTVEDLFPTPFVCTAGKRDDVIVVTGSIYLLGEVLCRLEPQRGPGEGRLQDF
jgi:dihydrofolate synthase / folylpolyglutamate synthase